MGAAEQSPTARACPIALDRSRAAGGHWGSPSHWAPSWGWGQAELLRGRAAGSWRPALLQQGLMALERLKPGPEPLAGQGKVIRARQACGCPQGSNISFPSSKMHPPADRTGPCRALQHRDLTAVGHPWATSGDRAEAQTVNWKGQGMKDLGSSGEVEATINKPQRGEGSPRSLSLALEVG